MYCNLNINNKNINIDPKINFKNLKIDIDVDAYFKILNVFKNDMLIRIINN